MNYIMLDLIAAAFLLLFVWRGYSRGFVKTLCGFLAVFVAFIGASIISSALSHTLSSYLVPMLETGIHNALENALQNALPSGSGTMILPEDLPLSGVLEVLKDSPWLHGLLYDFQQAMENGFVSVTTDAARALAEYAALQLSRTVLFSLSFVVVMVVWHLFSRTLDLAFRLPVLYSINHLAGGIVGLLKGLLVMFIAAWLLTHSVLPWDVVAQTHLVRFFCTASPLSLLGWFH